MSREVGSISVISFHPQTGRATIFLYDSYPSGMGYAEEAYRQFPHHAQATLETLVACTCEGGCYARVQSPKCGNQNRLLDKQGAISLTSTPVGQVTQRTCSYAFPGSSRAQ